MVTLGLHTTAPNGAPAPEHAATSSRGAGITILCLVNYFMFVLLGVRDDVTGFVERRQRGPWRARVPLLRTCIVEDPFLMWNDFASAEMFNTMTHRRLE